MRLNFYCFFLSIFLSAFQAVAQKLSNVRATLDSTTVSILYDLKGTIEGQLFTVELYSSSNTYESPLLYVSGEVGNRIQPGTNKQIIWQTKELTNFDGQITFDVRAVLSFSPFIMKLPKSASTFKRGKNYQIEWMGGIPTDKVTLELYRNNVKMKDIVVAENKGSYQWTVPAKTKPGGKYQLKVNSTTAPDNNKLSSNFTIRRRIPLLVKALPILAVGAAAYILLGSDNNPEPPTIVTNPNLLPEPDIPGN